MTIERMLWHAALALSGFPLVGRLMPGTFPRGSPALPSDPAGSIDASGIAATEARPEATNRVSGLQRLRPPVGNTSSKSNAASPPHPL